jgi:perosamine synthetase
LSVPEIRGREWDYVKECLDTGWVSSVGSYVDKFEQLVADRAGTRYAVATVNGTAALHIALLLAGVEPEDEVVVSALTFIAPANAIRYAGAWPVFVDAEPVFWQMDGARVADFLEHGCCWDGAALWNRRTGRRIKAILPVHILGHPVDLAPILQVAEKFQLPVIEDATEGLGAKWRDRSLGGIGQAGCFSFNGNKIITTGGGGMLVTNDAEWARRAKYLTTQAKDDPVEYVHRAIGYNYRLTNLLAAMGCAQMEQLDAFIEAKRRIAQRYRQGLLLPGIRFPAAADDAFETSWMFTILVDPEVAGMDSRQLQKELAGEGIQTRPLWQPLHLSPAHQSYFALPSPVAERLYRDGLSLPCSAGLTEADQDTVVEAIRSRISGRDPASAPGLGRTGDPLVPAGPLTGMKQDRRLPSTVH